MKKRIIVFIVMAILATTGMVFPEIMGSRTYSMSRVNAGSYGWTQVSSINLEPYTDGIAPQTITVSWQSGGGVVEKVRLYKDDVYVEKDVPINGTSMVFTEPEVLGISCAHIWRVQFRVSYALYNYVWVESTIRFYGQPVAESGVPEH